LLAVAEELKKLEPQPQLSYIGHRGDNLHGLVGAHAGVGAAYKIFAGKFRRYHGAGWTQFFDLLTTLKNIRDGFMILIGLFQSIILIRKLKPDVVFIKGGFVGVPVGLAARFWRVAYVTHDSDALPGLANRLLARGASAHAVAMPKASYNYPAEKTIEVGVPVMPGYQYVTSELMSKARLELNIPDSASVLFVTGGGNGSRRVNNAVVSASPNLFASVNNLYILHQVGKKLEAECQKSYLKVLDAKTRNRVRVYGFTDKMQRLSTSANLVISRSGATAMAEFAMQGKAVVVVPNPILTGGHQLKNAAVFEAKKACVVVREDALDSLGNVIIGLLHDRDKRRALGEELHKFAKPDAAELTAQLILSVAQNQFGAS
ncbi:MAG: glycosyltransferase, partial [Candidatus Saccharibacteria bacterium]|nr:glycosyltransferase [Candidatus Saccharibacteria bacterium]